MENHTTEWTKEQERVDYTTKKVKNHIKELVSRAENVKQQAEEIRNNFWEDVTVNFDEPDDVIETITSIKQQAELLSERERSYGHVEENVKTLQKLAFSPYFARVDFREEDEPLEQIYIGIASFLDEQDQYLVYDWRAPISSIYYDGIPGPVSYKTPEGKRFGEMELKRQFLIRDGIIQSMFDTGVTIGDEMLQEILGAKANTHMKSIVATIQKEQNKIIRDIKSQLLFVQGAAGSGKTSVALQRIAFLLYHFRESLSSEQIILFSPNPLFNSYISKVLPELGENNMVQTTFYDYSRHRIGKDLEVESLFEQFENRLKGEEQANIREKAITIKGSIDFYHAIERYVKELPENGVCFRDIVFRGKQLISKQEISELLYSYDGSYSLPNRFPLVAKQLLKVLDEKAREEEEEEWVEEEMELMDKEDFLEAFKSIKSNKKDDVFDSFTQEKSFLAKQIVGRFFKKLKRSVRQYRFFHKKAQYLHFLEQIPNLLDLSRYGISHSEWQRIRSQTIEQLRNRQIQMEDAVPFMYLSDLIEGKKSQTSMKYVFIDEIQDYTPIQLAYLRFLFPYSKFTMLGDINQSIHGADHTSKIKLAEEIFGQEKSEIVYLKKSYRSTLPITRFTKAILADGEEVELFERDGELPEVLVTNNKNGMLEAVYEEAKRLSTKSNTVAIIGKSMQQCEEAYKYLQMRMEVTLLGMETREFNEGVIVIPSYLAKGLEFDSVIVLNASDEIYHKESERKLLYTICTRAMHRLFITSIGKPTRLLASIPEEFYKRIYLNER
ncbi:RNA polymerase recycling motor HelD [Bacillus sp. FJAT-49736]|uniref:RNA polymerase recycling motor HelD n=1 Tax=Bacillus sp. FJAT-49736 TaxID=2833582 RepID=UPI001BCA2C80|nr:RNA polymerase recycling motor HelD [Bacillus sp. FJAT-49736]MBS4173998.1 AAA family ATPase [Bacillus sp. FJAT-49736]